MNIYKNIKQRIKDAIYILLGKGYAVCNEWDVDNFVFYKHYDKIKGYSNKEIYGKLSAFYRNRADECSRHAINSND